MPIDERDDDGYDGVTIPVMCEGCGCLFDFHPGDEPETDLCPTCRDIEATARPEHGA